jgi:hypothetical protein
MMAAELDTSSPWEFGYVSRIPLGDACWFPGECCLAGAVHKEVECHVHTCSEGRKCLAREEGH